MVDYSSVLNFSAPLDVAQLDNVVKAFYGGPTGPQQQQAQVILTSFQDHPEAWMRADAILEKSTMMQSKYLALNILEKLVQTRWKVLPAEQREGIKGYVVSQILKVSSGDNLDAMTRQFLSKFNIVLVQILKQEWPRNWPTFISEILSSARTSAALCENNMVILKLLSEEVFDFSADQMTQSKTQLLKTQFRGEFSSIFHLCQDVLEKAEKPSLIAATLGTLLRFLSWIPTGFIFQTNIIHMLAQRFLIANQFRNLALKCLTEIASLSEEPEHSNEFSILFTQTVQVLRNIVPPGTDFAEAYELNSEHEQEFVQDLAMFFTVFMGKHLALVEKSSSEAVLIAHQYLLQISCVEDRENFKVCLEYWNKLLKGLYEERRSVSNPRSSFGLMVLAAPMREKMYKGITDSLRMVMIRRMVKPEEVLIVENEDGAIVRESMREVDTIVLYEGIREALVYLTHLDPAETERVMIDLLCRQSNMQFWNWSDLNRLCWAIGSISGAMLEETEKIFLVRVVKDLLSLVEVMEGKDNKAVVASNIMYVVGQYPRFLKAHWRFLKTVVVKLFEFMHELHEGVQDMACDTFIKITKRTKKHFIERHALEPTPFIEEILAMVGTHTSELQPQQLHVFYEAVGQIIEVVPQRSGQERMIELLMAAPNGGWDSIMAAAAAGHPVLESLETISLLVNVLRTNTATCRSVGAGFKRQISRIFMDMLGLYCASSGAIRETVSRESHHVVAKPIVKGLRSIKKEILQLVRVYVECADNLEEVASQMVPKLLDACLGDYAMNQPQARDAEVLHVVADIVVRLGRQMNSQVLPILNSVFSCTLEMINKELIEYPEHRTGFFKLLGAVVRHCFAAVVALPADMFGQVMHSIVWGFKHTMRDIAETSLEIISDLIRSMATVADPVVANAFYSAHYLQLLQDIFFVLTDSEHKSGFRMQCIVVAQMTALVTNGVVQIPLAGSGDSGGGVGGGGGDMVSNASFLRWHLCEMFKCAFPHLSEKTVHVFVVGLLELNCDIAKFKPHVCDFLIQLKEFVGDADDLFLEERERQIEAEKAAALEAARLVPGLVKGHHDTNDDDCDE